MPQLTKLFCGPASLQSSPQDIGRLKQAVQIYDRALALDPQFVLAMANLSILHSRIYHNNEPADAERDLARRYAERALTLKPDSPEAHLACGYFLYYGQGDNAGALHEFDVARRGLPNDERVDLMIGEVQGPQKK
ncbi:MAG: hypothetical protein ABI217_12775 [Chthoniobacterales bacterium]